MEDSSAGPPAHGDLLVFSMLKQRARNQGAALRLCLAHLATDLLTESPFYHEGRLDRIEPGDCCSISLRPPGSGISIRNVSCLGAVLTKHGGRALREWLITDFI